MAETRHLPDEDPEFGATVLRYLDDALSSEELAAFNRELAASPARRARFVQLCLVESLAAEELAPASQQPVDAPDATTALETAYREIAGRPAARPRRGAGPLVSSWPGYAVAAMLVIAVGLGWYLQTVAPPAGTPAPVVASLTDAWNARWQGGAPAADGVRAGTALNLTAGCAMLRFTGGASVIIEAPARFTLTSSAGVSLDSGRLVATMAGGGFTVSTPTAAVLDLGTEFGVGYEPGAETRVDVFEGKVKVGAGRSTPSQLFTAGQAATVSSVAVTPDPAGALPQHFIRHLATPAAALDVVDLLAGGDGTGHRRGTVIDIFNERSGPASAPDTGRRSNGRHSFTRVASLPVIDGGFVPDGVVGADVVDSAGHTFTFPPTSNETFGVVGVGLSGPMERLSSGAVTNPNVLNGVDYSTTGHGLLMLHSNKGLTLDLGTIRRLHPGAAPRRFRCLVGNSYSNPRAVPLADAWVLVDGQLRFERREFRPTQGPFDVEIELHDADRFLTLVTTDGGDGIGHDWVLWADPRLELSPVAPTAAGR